jgi:hypothetical protein
MHHSQHNHAFHAANGMPALLSIHDPVKEESHQRVMPDARRQLKTDPVL